MVTGEQKTALWCTCRVLQVLDSSVQQLSQKMSKALSKTYDAGMAYVLWYANLEMGMAEGVGTVPSVVASLAAKSIFRIGIGLKVESRAWRRCATPATVV